MKTLSHPIIIGILWLLTLSGVQALDPSSVDGSVTVEVDHSEPVWKIKVTNTSEQKLTYEMMGKSPRGLGIELWEDWSGARIHAEDLAKYLGVDGFYAADNRDILPGKSVTFDLNPKSMSATNDRLLAEWRNIQTTGYYDCRVFFGIHASRMLHITPKRDSGQQGDAIGATPKANAGTIMNLGAWTKEHAGIRIRNELNRQNLSLVDWHRGSDHEGEFHVELTTSNKDDFSKNVPWDGMKDLQTPLNLLVQQAGELARKSTRDFSFEGLMMNPCEDDPSKRFATISFQDNATSDEISIHLLLNGASTVSRKIPVTREEYKELEEHGIPMLGEGKVAGQTGTEIEAKPGDGVR